MRKLASTLVAVLVLTGSGLASADSLAVLVSEQVNVSEDDAYAWADELSEVVARTGIDVLSSSEVRAILANEKVEPTCYMDPGCLRKLGERFGANELMVLHIVKVAGRVQIDSTWYDLGSGRSSVRGSLAFKDDASERSRTFEERGASLRPGGDPIGGGSGAAGGDEESINLGLWVSAGVGAGLLVGAVTFTIAAFNADDDAKQCAEHPLGDSGDCSIGREGPVAFLPELRDKRDTRALAADLFWLGTGLAAASTVLFAVLGGDSDQERPPVSIAPTRGGAAVTWGLRF